MRLLPSPRHSFLYFVLCLFGLLLATAGVTMFALGLTTANWPTVPGKILSASVHASTSTKAQRTYSAELAYEYTVGGKTYLGTFTRIGGLGFAYEPAAEQYVDGKRKEAAISVYYFPLYPALAVIELGYASEVWIFVFAGMGFFLVFRLLGAASGRIGR
jgi:hypothetical protein